MVGHTCSHKGGFSLLLVHLIVLVLPSVPTHSNRQYNTFQRHKKSLKLRKSHEVSKTHWREVREARGKDAESK